MEVYKDKELGQKIKEFISSSVSSHVDDRVTVQSTLNGYEYHLDNLERAIEELLTRLEPVMVNDKVINDQECEDVKQAELNSDIVERAQRLNRRFSKMVREIQLLPQFIQL